MESCFVRKKNKLPQTYASSCEKKYVVDNRITGQLAANKTEHNKLMLND
jgi:hypothetical protein